MNWDGPLSLIDVHAEGEVGRVIVSGAPEIPGESMAAKRRYLQDNDELRRFCLYEPRGGAAMSVNLVLPPCDPQADLGMIVMESTDYPAMSGSNAMCVVTALLESGRLPMQEPISVVHLDTPAGLIEARALCRAGKVENVTIENVASFLVERDLSLELEDLGRITLDIAYGGAFFALVDIEPLGLRLIASEARRLVELGQSLTRAAAEAFPVRHPEREDIAGVTFTFFVGKADRPGGPERGAVVVAPGRLDRSPCGTGTSARLAARIARGELRVGEKVVQESLIGTRFKVEAIRETRVGPFAAVVPALTGRAWVFATHELRRDPSDPFPLGFTLPDTWGPGSAPS